MAHQDFDQLSALRTRYVRIVREYTGLHETLALTFANALIDELHALCGGSYIPLADQSTRDQAIRDSLTLGQKIEDICREFGVSRTTVYRAAGTKTT